MRLVGPYGMKGIGALAVGDEFLVVLAGIETLEIVSAAPDTGLV